MNTENLGHFKVLHTGLFYFFFCQILFTRKPESKRSQATQHLNVFFGQTIIFGAVVEVREKEN